MSPGADSAGIPFAGREFRPHPFAGDDGSTPQALATALERWNTAWISRRPEEVGRAFSDILDALRTDRVLVPLLAEAGELGHTPEGRLVDKTQELSVVTVAGPAGERVGICCSSTAELQAWRVDARPIPVEALRVAGWALTEALDYVVLDPANTRPVIMRPPALASWVTGEPYLAPWLDSAVVEAIEAQSLWNEGRVVKVAVEPGWHLDGGTGPDIVARVLLVPGLDRAGLDEVTELLSTHWAASELIAQRVAGIRLHLEATDSEAPGS